MKSTLRILHLEDDSNDSNLIHTALKSGGISCSLIHAKTVGDFAAATELGNFDIILSDFAVPGCDGLAVLKIARAKWPEIPFILVSGRIGEECAIEAIKSGATDYILKDRLLRLAPAVRRAVKEVEQRAERKRLEDQFIGAQKMEVIGQLASGVAHDFNNVLGVIIGYSELMMQALPADHSLRKPTEEIRHAADRANALTRQLLLFSRKQALQTVVLDLNEVMAGMDKMLHRLVDENIAMTISPDDYLWRTKADPGQIGQVLMNLVINARDAMPNGGEITIETHNTTVSKSTAAEHANVPAGDYVLLSVRDTGAGMTDEVKEHLFEAFFTTKPKGKGTGLGLATCKTIVNQCDGHINVVSQVGKGTTFKTYLPRVDDPLETSAQPAKGSSIPRGTETLLLVEDEPSVRHLACGVLESLGYNVLRANNGQEGLHAARESRGRPISLVVTDVIMPQMSGKVMAEWLKATYPSLKVLFTSGYTDDAIAHHGVLEPGVAFLPKPYSPAALARKVRELLDENADEAPVPSLELEHAS